MMAAGVRLLAPATFVGRRQLFRHMLAIVGVGGCCCCWSDVVEECTLILDFEMYSVSSSGNVRQIERRKK